MYITRKEYDATPLMIRQGALLLWGIPLARFAYRDQVRHIYRLNDFYAEVRYDEGTGRLVGILTFTSPHQLAPYLNRMNLQRIDQPLWPDNRP